MNEKKIHEHMNEYKPLSQSLNKVLLFMVSCILIFFLLDSKTKPFSQFLNNNKFYLVSTNFTTLCE